MNSELVHDLLSIVKGFRNGLVYGVKIRLPHAFVMTFLFQNRTIEEKLRSIAWATKQHAWNLGRFTAVYKASVIFLKHFTGKEASWHSFLGGALGGYLIFSKESSVNTQIILYLLSRVICALVTLAYERLELAADSPVAYAVSKHAYTLRTSIVWGLVMWLFRDHRHTLQSSLQASMQYLYLDSNSWTGLMDFLVFNKRKSE